MSEEFAKLVDTSGNLVEGAILKVSKSGLQVGNKGADILGASLNVGDAFSLECAKEDTFDHLEHILSSAFSNNVIRVTPVSTACAIFCTCIAKVASGPERAVIAAQIG